MTDYKPMPPLLLSLRNKNISSLYDPSIGSPQLRGRLDWKNVISIGLPEALFKEWESFITLLCENFISLDEETTNSLCWSKNPVNGSCMVKLGYKA